MLPNYSHYSRHLRSRRTSTSNLLQTGCSSGAMSCSDGGASKKGKEEKLIAFGNSKMTYASSRRCWNKFSMTALLEKSVVRLWQAWSGIVKSFCEWSIRLTNQRHQCSTDLHHSSTKTKLKYPPKRGCNPFRMPFFGYFFLQKKKWQRKNWMLLEDQPNGVSVI